MNENDIIGQVIQQATAEAFDSEERIIIMASSPLGVAIREALQAHFILIDRRNLPQITDEQNFNASEEWHEETAATAKHPFGEEHQTRTAWLNLARAEFIRTRTRLIDVRRRQLAEDFNGGSYGDLPRDVQGLINHVINLERQVTDATP
jgi:hypothetical protein